MISNWCLTASDSAATARTPPGRASRASVTSRCAIRINSNLIGSRALALSDRSASLRSSSVFCQNYQFATHRFGVDSANAGRQFLEHNDVPPARIQVAWDAISLHTTPGIAAYKPLEVELLYNGVGLDVLGIGYEHFPEDLRKKIVDQYPRINFKQDIAKAFLGGFEFAFQGGGYWGCCGKSSLISNQGAIEPVKI